MDEFILSWTGHAGVKMYMGQMYSSGHFDITAAIQSAHKFTNINIALQTQRVLDKDNEMCIELLIPENNS